MQYLANNLKLTIQPGPAPRVSVGMPVYNGEPYVKEAIESLLVQTFTDFELVISDNASTDRTGEISRAYAAKDDRIRYHCNEKNLGLAGNYNRVFALAKGEYFKWATADDVCRPNYLARCVEVLDRDPTVVLAYPRTQFVDLAAMPLDIHDPGWNLRSDEAHERLRYVIFAGHWANAVVGLIRAGTLAKTRLMPAYPGGDFRVLGELSLLGKFYEIPECLYVRRLHPGSSSQASTNPDAKWLVRYWTGTDSSVSLPGWSISIDHFRTIMRSQLPFRQKLTLTRLLLRHMRWRRRMLLNELWAAVTAYFYTAPAPREGRQGGECC